MTKWQNVVIFQSEVTGIAGVRNKVIRIILISCSNMQGGWGVGWHFKNAYEDLRALKILMLYKNDIFQCKGQLFCV